MTNIDRNTAPRNSARALTFSIVWLLLSIGGAAALIYLNWEYVVANPVRCVLVIAVAALASAIRTSAAALEEQVTVSLSFLALTLLYPGVEHAWTVYGWWSIGTLIGVTWAAHNIVGASFGTLVSMIGGAVLVAVRGLIPPIGPEMPFINADRESVAIIVSVLVGFIVVGLIVSVVLWIQLGIRPGTLYSGVGWSRIALITLPQAPGGVLANGIAIWLSQNMVMDRSMDDLFASMVVMLLVAGIMSIGISQRRNDRHLHREEALVNSLSVIPWPNNASVRTQTENQLTMGLPDFVVETMPVERYSALKVKTGRMRVSHQVEDDKGAFVATIRRGAFGRPFTVSDQRYIDAIAMLAQQSVRAEREMALLHSVSNTDIMTGLLNYRALRTELTKLAGNGGREDMGALILLQLQDLNLVNEEYGPKVGDELLRTVALRLREGTKNWENGSAYRIAGDEFAILVKGLASRREAETLTWDIDTEVSHPVQTASGPVTVSMAQTIVFADTSNPMEVSRLIARADEQLYGKRRKYISTAVGIDADNELLEDEAEFNADVATIAMGPSAALVDAIRSDRLSQVYQPIVDRITGEIVAVESSVRYTDPIHGLLPVTFLRTEADRLGLRSRMVVQVMRHSVADMERFRILAPELACLHLNISPAQLVDREFTLAFEQVREEHPDLEIVLELDADTIRVAPTETAEKAALYAATHDVLIALDNTGTNYSELSALILYPVTMVKISDRVLSLVHSDRTRESTREILTALDATGVTIIIDGITRSEEAEFVERSALRFVQGPLYGNPVSASELLVRLDTLGLQLA